MHKKRRRTAILLIGLLLAVGFVVIGAVASAFAYRQFVDRENGNLSLPLRERIIVQDRSQNEAGIVVLNVDEQGPAASAGLQWGTVILQVDGVDVNSVAELRDAIAQYKAGDVVTITILNGEEPEEVEVTLESAGPYLGVTVGDDSNRFRGGHFDAIPNLPPDATTPGIPGQRGFSDMLPDIPRQFIGPIVVLQLEPDGPAEAAGLEPGDILTEFNDQAIESRDSFVEQVGGTEPGGTVALTVQRGADTLTVNVILAARTDDPERGYLGIHIGPPLFDEEFFSEPGFHGDFFGGFSDQRRGQR